MECVMDRVKCDHGLHCMLKTGTKAGPSNGRSFYMCPKPSREQCSFLKEVKLPVMQCPQHGALVGLRMWNKKNPNEINYFCTLRGSKMWCGSLDIKEAEKENADPHPLEKSKKMATKAGGKSNASRHKVLQLSMAEESSSSEEEDDASESRAVVVTDQEEQGQEAVVQPTSSDTNPASPLLRSDDSTSEVDDSSQRPDESDSSTDQSVSSGDETRSDVEESSYMEDESRDDTVNITSDSVAAANESSLILSVGKPERVIDPTVYRSTVIIDSEESESGEEEDGASEGSHQESHLTHPDTDGSYVEVVDSSCREEEEEEEEVTGGEEDEERDGEEEEDEEKDGEEEEVTRGEEDEERDGEEEEVTRGEEDEERDGEEEEVTGREEDEERDGEEEEVTGGEEDEDISGGEEEEVTGGEEDEDISGGEEEEVTGGEEDEDISGGEEEEVTGGEDEEEKGGESPRSVYDQSLSSVETSSDNADLHLTKEGSCVSPDSGVSLQEGSEGLSKLPLEKSSVSQHSLADPSPQKEVEVLDTTSSDEGDSGSSPGADAIHEPGRDETDYVSSIPPCSSLSKPAKPSPTDASSKGHRREGLDKPEPQFKVGYQYRTLVQQLETMERLIHTMSNKLPDGGAQLRAQKQAILNRMAVIKRPIPEIDLTNTATSAPAYHNKKGQLTYQAKMLTTGAVEHIHSSLENCPTDTTLADDPDGLRVDLMIHQKRALAWLEWRETQTPSGGILADDMGLGKTLSMLSLVLKKKGDSQDVRKWLAKPPAVEGLLKCPGTLVVCPASLMMQWEAEVNGKIRPGLVRAKVYHGSNRTKFASDLANYDLVITTYNIVGVEGASCEDDDGFDKAPGRRRAASISTLFHIHWKRVILDEAHVIRNPKTALSTGVCRLKCDHRWAVTGTPIQNKLKDFYSLIRFIRLAPFDDFYVWRDTVEKKQSLGMQRLNTIVSGLVLRRTKGEMGPELLKLTKRVVETHQVQLKPAEQQVYDALFFEARKVFVNWLREHDHFQPSSDPTSAAPKPSLPADVARVVDPITRPYVSGSSGRRGLLALLLRLRQCCCHLQLLTSAMLNADMETGLEEAMESLSLGNSGSSYPVWGVHEVPQVFKREEISTKLLAVMQYVRKIYGSSDKPPQKCLIVSQWTSFLDIMQYHLDRAGIAHARIDGKVPPKQRAAVVGHFNSPFKDPSVMLLALQAGGVGLNLTSANHVFMLDIHWNPALEVQAADRCHRVGQTRDVYIHRFVCEGTVEERIMKLQEQKLQLAQNVLSGASEGARDSNKLTLSDLKDLFAIQ